MTAATKAPIYCVTPPELCPRIADISSQAEKIKALEHWQTMQNGSLRRIEDKVDGLKNWIIGALLSGLLALCGVIAVLLRPR